MDEFIQFIVDYWQYISVALVIIITIISMCFKKKPMSLDEFQLEMDRVIQFVPYLVRLAEDEFGSGTGDQKKDYVLNVSEHKISRALGRKLTDNEKSKFRSAISSSIEDVLGTPTKKVK